MLELTKKINFKCEIQDFKVNVLSRQHLANYRVEKLFYQFDIFQLINFLLNKNSNYLLQIQSTEKDASQFRKHARLQKAASYWGPDPSDSRPATQNYIHHSATAQRHQEFQAEACGPL